MFTLLAQAAQEAPLPLNALFNLGGTVTVVGLFVYYLTGRDKAISEATEKARTATNEIFSAYQKSVERLNEQLASTARTSTEQLQKLTESHVEATRNTAQALEHLRDSIDSLRMEISRQVKV